MSHRDEPSVDTVSIILERIQRSDDSQVTARAAERLLRRAEPIARVVCRTEARSLPESHLDELVQDTLELVWRRLPTLEQNDRFDSWVRGIARHVCANARRRRKDVLTEDGVLEATSPERDALRLLRQEERERVLNEAIAQLEQSDQDVLYHRYIHHLERDRIAEVLGLEDAEAVRVVLQRASRRLRAELQRTLQALGHGPSLLHTESS
jgi:RNA polymerase sigma-70 factor (ECF subfamily)